MFRSRHTSVAGGAWIKDRGARCHAHQPAPGITSIASVGSIRKPIDDITHPIRRIITDTNTPTIAYFIGPDDGETCAGCRKAVNGNPYTLATVPKPGTLNCGSRCRHMVQLDGDIPAGVHTTTWSASLSIDKPDPLAVALEEPPPTADEIAIADLTPDQIAHYLQDQHLQIQDADSLLSFDHQAEIRAEMQAIGYAPPDAPDATSLDDLLAIDAKLGIRAYLDAHGIDAARRLGASGFDQADSKKAYSLAEALDRFNAEAKWRITFLTSAGRFYVTDKLGRKRGPSP